MRAQPSGDWRLERDYENWENARKGRFIHTDLDSVEVVTLLHYEGFDAGIASAKKLEQQREEMRQQSNTRW